MRERACAAEAQATPHEAVRGHAGASRSTRPDYPRGPLPLRKPGERRGAHAQGAAETSFHVILRATRSESSAACSADAWEL